MLGRITGIVCLAVAGFASQAHAQSMDMMSMLTLSNRFINPVTQYQPVSFTAEDGKQAADSRAAVRASPASNRADAQAAPQAKPGSEAECPIQQVSLPR